MTDRPIIFSAPMVRALLAGRKTQTRRILRPQPDWLAEVGSTRNDSGPFFWPVGGLGQQCGMPLAAKQVRFAISDRLYVREACRAEELSRPPQSRPATKRERELTQRTHLTVADEMDGMDGVRFFADDAWLGIKNTSEASDLWSILYSYRDAGKDGIGATVPPIHMPRWASRLTLTVTDVRVQRLQAISEADAMAEGIEQHGRFFGLADTDWDDAELSAAAAYGRLWNSLHGADAWAENPWVVALTFTVDQRNIDA